MPSANYSSDLNARAHSFISQFIGRDIIDSAFRFCIDWAAQQPESWGAVLDALSDAAADAGNSDLAEKFYMAA